MRQQAFEQAHAAEWQAFEAQLGRASRRAPEAASLEAFPERYRRLCHHLALAQERRYTSGLVERLHDLVARGHAVLYAGGGGLWRSWGSFLRGGLARQIRARRDAVLLASALFFLPQLLLPLAIRRNPEVAFLVEEPRELARYEAMYRGEGGRFGREGQADTDLAMFGHYVWNNVRVSFQCFASGLFLGVGSAFYLLWNGLHGGAVAGHLIRVGLGPSFGSFVATHSAFELPALILCGAAGLGLGAAVAAPGRRGRLHALQQAVRDHAGLVYAAAFLDLLAAGLEAFWSASAAVPPGAKLAAGAALWTAGAAYVLFAGRRHA